VSKTTGWRYNNPFFGGFEVRDMRGQPTGPGLVFVPGGTFTMGRVAEDIPGDWNNVPRRVSIGSYYIDATEVRNVDYREYLHWLAMVYVSYPDVARAALPDTLSWRKPLAYNEPLVEYYFRLASFNEYPVVGVSWIQACDFCSWRTDRVNEVTLLQAGILELDIQGQKDDNCFTTDAYLAGVYEGKVRRNLPDLSGRKPEGRRVSYEDGILFPKYRLPTEAEWEYAAVAPIGSPVTGMVPDRGPYPWRGYQLRKTDITGTKSMVLANFQKGRGDLMGVAGNTEGSPTPMPVVSFYPNDFGLYCMAGNVNEWVLDVYRALTFEEMNDARPYRGNIYTTMVTDETGTPVKDHLGRIKRDTLGYVTDRENYKVGDNRNYEDGDILSSMPTEGAGKKEAQISSNRMYYQGKGENHLGMSSLVNERSRVYKGGSFMDRAYWLSPGTRRFLDEGRAKEDIGFRCAMDRMGASEFRAASPR
jgi:gliding motility-associated lipoprotein GldJ